ncbi:MAG: putative Histidine kinase [Promethearchaeota archaeon]|nr:MAG: putative Histidine kinase [Candidatus Lokiarchaeota archaeon]
MSKEEPREPLSYYLDFSQALIVLIGPNKQVKFINEFGATLLGYDKEEIIGKNWFNTFIPPDNREEINNVFENIFEGSKQTFKSYTNEIVLKNGSKRKIFWNNSLIIDKNNKIIGILSLGKDITNREELKRELRNEKDVMGKIIEASPVGITFVNKEGKIIYANDHAERILGLSRSKIAERTYNTPDWQIKDYQGKSFPNEDLPFSIVKRRKKPIFHVKHTIQSEVGEVIYLDINATPLFDDNNHFNGMVAILQDVTSEILKQKEIVKSDIKLNQSEKLYRTLFEGARDAIFLMNREEFIKCNKKTLEMFGCEKYEEIIGKKPWKFSPEYQPDGFRSKKKAKEFITEALEGQPQRFYWKHTRKDGSSFNTEVTLNHIKIEDEPIIQAIVRDISDLRKAYNRVELYKDIFTHDINNILQGTLTGLQLLEHYHNKFNFDEEEIQDVMYLLKNQVIRGERLVSNIHKLSEFEDSKNEKEDLKPINPLAIMKKVIKKVKERYGNRQLKLDVPSPPQPPIVQANKSLEDVFENIILNAIQHNEREVVIINIQIAEEKRKRQQYIKFTFEDNARGIEASQKRMIFLRDHINQKTDENLYGLGLGLTLVKRIIDYYGGEIWVEDKVPGDYTQGSKFHILVPE